VQPEEPLTDEPVSEEPAKPARRARRTKAQIESDERADTTAAATKDYHDRLAAAKAQAGQDPAREETDAEVETRLNITRTEKDSPAGHHTVFTSLDVIKVALSDVYQYFTKQSELMALAMLSGKPEEVPLAAAVRLALEALEEGITFPAAEEAPKRGRGRPRKEPDASDTTAYFEDGDGIIRVATRGRPRRGETRVELTALEVEVKTEAGLVDND